VSVEIALLGPPRVAHDGQVATFDTRKAVAVLAHLALAETPRSREALCELLWPRHDPERARGALRRTLSTVRKAIGEEWLETTGDAVALRLGAGLDLDVARFRELAGPEATLEDLGEAVAIFSGEFLEGFSVRDSAEFEHWHATQTEILRRELASALRRLIEGLSERGDHEQALPHAERWLELDPVHEPAHRELIRLYARTGDRAGALEQYRRCVRTLSQELGVAPLPETVAVYEQVEEGNVPGPPPAGEPVPRPDAPPQLPLLGRAAELADLVDAHARAEPDGALAVIEGEAGIGKTRLAEELAGRAQAAGATVLAARCHDDEAGIPYGPIVALLREALDTASQTPGGGWPARVSPQRLGDAALLLPDLSGLAEGTRPPPEGPGARTRLLEAASDVIAAACAGEVPGLVLIDDVHAADEATLDVIAYLGRRLRARSLLLVVTWRSELIAPGHRLRRLAIDLARDGRTTIVTPTRLGEAEVTELVEAADLPGVEPGTGRRVYLESEGLPLFVAEYIAALRVEADPAELALSPETLDLLDARLRPVSDVGAQVLGAAAAIGRSFDLETVRQASGRSDEETVGALDELVAHGLVREVPGPQPVYDFSHQKLRALAYDGTSLARRQLLHRRIATALATGGPGGESAAPVAKHRRLAGDRAEAATLYVRAAEQAAAVHAHADALEHLQSALGLGYPAASELHERIGDERILLGDYAGALASYESAAAECPPEALAAVEHKLGDLHHRRGEWQRAEARFLAALGTKPPPEPGLRARIQADLALSLHHAGEAERAGELATEALSLAQEAGDHRAEAQAHNLLGVLARNGGELELAREQLERSLALARELGDDPAQAAALNNLALVRRDAGEPAEALELTGEALALCAAYGDRHREAALENNLADLHHAAGRGDEAMAHLKRAVAIFSDVGGDEATRLPEIWKLVSW